MSFKVSGGAQSWNVSAAVDACPIGPWRGEAWRCHARRYSGDNADGSLKATGRYHRGRDRFPESEIWPALYTGLAPHIALAEMLRHTRALPELASKRLSRLAIDLDLVLDATNLTSSGAAGAPSPDDLCRPADYALSHVIAEAVRVRGAEALLTLTCTRLNGTNLIIFTDRLLPNSSIDVVETEDPDVYVDWQAIPRSPAT